MNETGELKQEKRAASPSDYLANERTFLAWTRTAIAIMAFGFVVVRFSLFVKQISFALHEKTSAKGYSSFIGIFLVGLGAVIALLAFLRYRHIQKQLSNGTYFPSLLLSLLFTIAILIISILLILYLVPSI